MKEFIGGFFIIILFIVAILGLTWIGQGNDFFLYKYFGPKYEQQRREIFEQSKAYNQGMIQELQAMQREYIKATPEQQESLASVIMHDYADYNDRNLPDHLRVFMSEIRNKNLGK